MKLRVLVRRRGFEEPVDLLTVAQVPELLRVGILLRPHETEPCGELPQPVLAFRWVVIDRVLRDLASLPLGIVVDLGPADVPQNGPGSEERNQMHADEALVRDQAALVLAPRRQPLLAQLAERAVPGLETIEPALDAVVMRGLKLGFEPGLCDPRSPA